MVSTHPYKFSIAKVTLKSPISGNECLVSCSLDTNPSSNSQNQFVIKVNSSIDSSITVIWIYTICIKYWICMFVSGITLNSAVGPSIKSGSI